MVRSGPVLRQTTRRRALRAILCVLGAGSILGACSTVPENIRAPLPSPNISDVQEAPERYRGDQIRWGGSISETNNYEHLTVIKVVARPLARNGRPQASEQSIGRFMVEIPQFLDPDIYEKGRLLTVFGTLSGLRSARVGEHTYDYPVVAADTTYLWEPYPDYGYPHYYPYYYPYPYSYWHFYHPYPWRYHW